MEKQRISLRVGADLLSAFRVLCTRKQMSVSVRLRTLMANDVIESFPDKLTSYTCRACGVLMLHGNVSMPYCSHECAGISTLPAELLRTGQNVVSKDGEYGVVAYHHGNPRACIFCARTFLSGELHGSGTGGNVFCLKHAVLGSYDYTRLLQEPETAEGYANADDVINMFKKGGE